MKVSARQKSDAKAGSGEPYVATMICNLKLEAIAPIATLGERDHRSAVAPEAASEL
jgi:hypothetical protein